jgi:hypothetical protein
MIMRYSKAYQDIADRYARENDYIAASYIGVYNDSLVFEPIYQDSLPRTVGLPSIIVVNKDGSADEIRDLISFDILRETHRRDLVKGRLLFHKYEAMLDAEDVSETDREYAAMIVKACDYSWNERPIEKNIMYVYLETADRLNMTLEVKRDEGENYIELTQRKGSTCFLPH